MTTEISPESTTSHGPPQSETGPVDRGVLKRAAECILLVSGSPVRPEQLQESLSVPAEAIHELIADLRGEYADRGLQIQEVAGGYQLCTRPELSPYVQRFLRLDHQEALSHAALETLAIIAYRQPVTRAEIEAVRGVRCEHVLERLLGRHLIREVGRRRSLGRPILYGTTDAFLKHFGLKDLASLPALQGHDPRTAFEFVAPGGGEESPRRG